ncbi:MAG TPA: cysteine synthase A [Candidatus Wirthbacteria bacterium]|nr:cysteine synthase A [Candidatus Wirthbacteria bacterium]
MPIYQNISQLIGHTPLVQLHKFAPNLPARLLAKLEAFNPSGSSKDRAALAMIQTAEEQGLLNPGATVIEPTSGNTGIGLAMICSQRGYRAIFVMPADMSPERQTMLKAYGAQIILTPAESGMAGAVQKAEQLASDHGYYLPQQFANPANPEAHRQSTALEIWDDTSGQIDILVAGIGTGGTITGTGDKLKQLKPDLQIIGIEPASSPVLSGGQAGSHAIQGIGAGFVPSILNTSVYDEIIRIEDQDALTATRKLARLEGILAGISSGACLAGAVLVAKRPVNRGKTIVAILPDSGNRYLSLDFWKN